MIETSLLDVAEESGRTCLPPGIGLCQDLKKSKSKKDRKQDDFFLRMCRHSLLAVRVGIPKWDRNTRAI